ncbi:MAG TPA: MFS transporter [Mycobacteriales bacterium]|nr:MFS transporter [Mycobacteriales bacterium]
MTAISGAAPAPSTRSLPWHRGGFVPLVRMHSVHTAGDALVAVSLAGTLFFSVPVGEARGKVALYLLTSMAPFAIVAPVVGPLLDRVRSGRRAALATTFATRAVVAWLMSGVDGFELYPLAFAVLVTSKAYGVARSAAVPRLRPAYLSLVAANARLSTSGVVAAAVAAGLGAGVVAVAGATWSLRLAALVFALGAGLALRLPGEVNSPDSELPPGTEPAPPVGLGDHARTAVLAAVSLRALSGYLTMFLAFLLRAEGGSTGKLGVVVAAGAAGSMTGTLVGGALRPVRPETLIVTALAIGAAGCGVAAQAFGVATAAVAALGSGAAGSLGKLSLDSVLQRDVPDAVRGQAFARSETSLQLSWVAGGAIGIVLPLRGSLGLGLATAAMLAATASTALAFRRSSR